MTKKKSDTAKKVTLDSVYEYSTQVICRANPNGTVAIMDLKDFNSFYELDAWAAELWMLVDGKRPMGEIYKKLATKSGLKPDYIEKQGVDVVRDMIKNGLLTSV